MGMEEAGRQARYDSLEKLAIAKGFDKIALGHHADDNAEQVLISLIRGGGMQGLAGIPAIRKAAIPDIQIIRPLIETPKKALLDWLKHQKIDYVQDQSNRDTRILRNRIRYRLLPELKHHYNPRIRHALNRLSNILREENEWIAGTITAELESSICGGDGQTELCLVSARLRALAPAQCRRLLRLAIQRLGKTLKPLSYGHVEAVIKLVFSAKGGKGLILPQGLRAYLSNNRLHLYLERHPFTAEGKSRLGLPPSLEPPGDYCYRIACPQDEPVRVYIKEAHAWLICKIHQEADDAQLHRAGHHVGFFDMRKLKFPLIVRNYRHGDRFRPKGLGGSQTLAKFFSGRKLAPRARRICPLLVSDETIIWVVGHRHAECPGCEAGARSLLEVEYKLA
jgi:tRNA(Ile)-lysidine synthase